MKFNWKLKRDFEKNILEELLRMEAQLSILEPGTKEYEELLDKMVLLAKVITDNGVNETKVRQAWIDNACAFAGMIGSIVIPIAFGHIQSPAAFNFLKGKLRH